MFVELLYLVYSALLVVALVVGAPWWLARMATSGRYRAGLLGRLGWLPAGLRAALASARGSAPDSVWVWVHAVSVGEVVAAVRLIEELRRVRPELRFAVSTTTETGQALARRRIGSDAGLQAAVFYMPLDLGWIVRRYLRAIRPAMLVLMESELWPNLIGACARMGVTVAVANARVSDRSYPRYMRLRGLWRPLLAQVRVFLAANEETAERLRRILGDGARGRVEVTGNLKYDVRVTGENRMAAKLRQVAAGRPVVVAGSTVQGAPRNEEEMVFEAMARVWEARPETLLVLAPRHPDRFGYACSLAARDAVVRASALMEGAGLRAGARQTVVLDTIGDLAAVYGLADVAFVGGSLVGAGGHNPLEAAQFGCPVVMGGSVENFRGIVEAMRAAEGIRMVQDAAGLGEALLELLSERGEAQALGARGRRVFEAEAGATARTARALVAMLPGAAEGGL